MSVEKNIKQGSGRKIKNTASIVGKSESKRIKDPCEYCIDDYCGGCPNAKGDVCRTYP